MSTTETATPLAIIGIGCLFPGADNLSAYWARIRNGDDAITDVPSTHWRAEDYYHPDPKAPDRIYTARGGFLDATPFNPAAFGIAPNSLEATDTAQLLGMVAAQQALNDAGYGEERSFDRSRVSVILGVTGTLELVIPLGARLGHPIWRRALNEAGVEERIAEDVVRRIGDSYVGWQENSFPGLLGNVVAGRIANRFDLGGTNCVVDAACASSLSAIHLAALELTAGRADMVLSGGVDTFNDIFMYMCFSKTPALSPTGDARPFDAAADGTILGEGLGMVVLKRLADARRDGDRVYAILRGMGSSSDGRGNAIYAPRAAGQVEAIRKAYRIAGVEPDTIEMVEAHGTGTRVGDATEVTALAEVYGEAEREGRWCALGSVKSQIGHTKAAAGVAGLIKAAAALHHKVLPPTIKVSQPLEPLQTSDSPFYVNTEPRPWLSSPDHPRRAAVSAFGFGGSNFHAVLEEAGPDKEVIDWDGDTQILAFSGSVPADIERQLKDWPTQLEWPIFRAFAAQTRLAWNATAACRLLLVVQRQSTDLPRLVESARTLLRGRGDKNTLQSPEGVFFDRGPRSGKLAVLFPGQGAQYPGMLRELACRFPAMHEALTQVDASAGVTSPARLIECVYPLLSFTSDDRRANDEALRATDIAQPALGAVSLGAWRILESFGVRADATAGHSFGELTALCVAGRLKAEEFYRLAHLRGRLMADAGSTDGVMLAVQATPETILDVLRAESLDLVLANKNAPRQTVLSGPSDLIARAAASFDSRKIRTQRLSVSAAFHSPLVAAAAEPLRAALADIAFHPGSTIVYANTTAQTYPDDSHAARDLLAGQLARPVEFVNQITNMHASGVRTFLEVGPGPRLTGLVSSILQGREYTAFALDRSNGQRSGMYDLASCLAQLAALGHSVDLTTWDADAPIPPSAETKKRALIVPIHGANYVKPKPKATRQPAAPATPSHPRTPNNGVSDSTMNGTHSPAISRAAAPPVANDAALEQALQLTRDSLIALQKMQDQTAQLHRQFLDGQDTAHRTVQFLVEQQQRLTQISLGLPVSAAPVAPQPAVVARVQPTTPPVAMVAPALSMPATRSVEDVRSHAERGNERGDAKRGNEGVEAVLLEVISEKTGYPTEMLELDMALDADLGIDSIKRVEILSALQERLPDAPVIEPEHLGTLRTLRQIAGFLRQTEAPSTPTTHDARLQAIRRNEREASDAREIERSVLRAVPLTNDESRQPLALPPGSTIWIGSEDGELASALDRHLRTRGHRPRRVSVAALREIERPATLGALLIVATRQPEDDGFLQHALFGLQHAGPALRAAGNQNGALFVTVSRMDGAFGLIDLDAGRDPIDGGLAGLAKTVAREWPEVQCKALDLADDFRTEDEAAAAIVEEMFLAGPVEVGLALEQRRTLERAVESLKPGAFSPFQAGDLIVVSGGARGVTAEVAVALARSFQATLLLLGRTPEPGPEPTWLASLESEADIKRELGKRANGGAALKNIGEQYRLLTAHREIRQTLARIEATGGRALYRSVDIRDAAAVKNALTTACQQLKSPVRAIVHGAGVLADARIEDKTDAQYRSVYETKIDGLRALLRAVEPDDLRALVMFSSSTGRFGRTGQVDYAIANEVLNKLAQQQARRLPRCRVVSVNWGPWDGGMVGPALKKVFAQEQIGLIPLEAGANYLVDELRSPPGDAVEVVVLAAGSAMPEGAAGSGVGVPSHPENGIEKTKLSRAFERVVERTTHPILESHILDGRPVLPTVLILEWLAHGALHQNPGLQFHGCDELRILHGVILDGDNAPTLRVDAGKANKRDGLYVVPVELRSSRADGREVLHARADIVLANQLPSAPAPLHPLHANPYVRTMAETYRQMLFHGPDFQGIERIETCGPQGVVGVVRAAPPPSEWLHQPLRQRWLADPLVLDCSFQMMVVWSQEIHNVPSLPCLLTRYRQYERSFPAGDVRVVVRITRDHDALALADIDYLDERGQLIARLEGYECVLDAALRRAFARQPLASAAP